MGENLRPLSLVDVDGMGALLRNLASLFGLRILKGYQEDLQILLEARRQHPLPLEQGILKIWKLGFFVGIYCNVIFGQF